VHEWSGVDTDTIFRNGSTESCRKAAMRQVAGDLATASLIDATATGSRRSPFQPITAEGQIYARSYGV